MQWDVGVWLIAEYLSRMDRALDYISNTTDGWLDGDRWTEVSGWMGGQADSWIDGRSPHCSHAHRQKLHEADLELQRKREYIEELETPTDSNSKWGPALARARGSPECGM